MSKAFVGLLILAWSSALVGAVDKMRHTSQCDLADCDAGGQGPRLGMRHTALANEPLKAAEISYEAHARSVEAPVPVDQMHASNDERSQAHREAADSIEMWGRRRRARNTPPPPPPSAAPPAAPAFRSDRDRIVHEEMEAIKAVEACASVVTNAMANSNDVKMIRSGVEQCRVAARQAKSAGHEAIKAKLGAMSDKEKTEVRQAVDSIKRQAQRSSLASAEEAWGGRRRRSASQAQRDAAMKEEAAGKNLELQAAILSKALEENREGRPTRSLLAQPEGESLVPGGSGETVESLVPGGSGEPLVPGGPGDEGSEDPDLLTNIDELVDSLLDAAENALNKALDAVDIGVGALRDILGNVFQGIRDLVGNILDQAGNLLSGLLR